MGRGWVYPPDMAVNVVADVSSKTSEPARKGCATWSYERRGIAKASGVGALTHVGSGSALSMAVTLVSIEEGAARTNDEEIEIVVSVVVGPCRLCFCMISSNICVAGDVSVGARVRSLVFEDALLADIP